ncbi:MAG TPA: preprotein translocase subunit SecE [Bryobacteraceae bacterium]|jgi:preprotein translocase subunit SecE|nr:preprotein translocase subunit SecE [Bryobacteraceae bacterium]
MAMAQVQSGDDSRSLGQRALGWPARFKNYVEELQLEMRRVTWPTWKQVRATTMVVIIATFAFAGYFFLVDFIVGRAITKIFDSLTR